MLLASIILALVLFAWGLIVLAIRQERTMRSLDATSLAALQEQARTEARVQSGALADLPSWRSLEPQAEHAFLGTAEWGRLSAWGDTIERGLAAKHARDEARLKDAGHRYRQQWEALKQLERGRLLRGYEVNARLVHHVRSVLQHEMDIKAGEANERSFVRQLAQDRLFVDLLQERVAREAKQQSWSAERLDVALRYARKSWAASASCTTSSGRFINAVLKAQEP